MNKRFILLFSGMISVLLLASCMNAIPELTEEENTMIVRYMADSVLANDENYTERLLTEDEVNEALLEEQKKAEKLKQIEEEEEKRKAEKEALNTPTDIEVKDIPKEYTDADISEFIGAENVQFKYTGYRFADKLPENDDSLAFVVAPSTSDNTLLVMQFDLYNDSDSDIEFLLPKDAKMSAVINQKNRISPLLTFMDEDLNCNFEKNIPAGGTYSSILVFEIPKSEEIDSLGLTVSYTGKEKININF